MIAFKQMRKTASVILLIFITLSLATVTQADTYPSKNIVWIVSSEPGGGFDTYARALSPYLTKYLPNNVNVIIKNVSGAGGLKGASQIFYAKPDGYTIGYIYYPGVAIIQLEKDIGFDPAKMVPIAQIAADAQGLFVSAKSDLKTLEDLRKKQPLRILTQPKGVTMFSFNVIADNVFNLKAKFVTGYKGSTVVATGLMRGDGDMGILPVNNFINYVESGDLRIVLTFTEKRHPLTPEVPSAVELGYPKATACKSWKVLFGPPGLPADVTRILQDAFNKATNDPELQAWADKTKRPLEYIDGQAAWKELQDIFEVYKQYR